MYLYLSFQGKCQPSDGSPSSIINLRCGAEFLFFSFAIVRCQNCNIESSTFLDVMYSHWEQCREVIEESVVCELLQTKFFFKWVEKVVVFYIFLDVSCEEFAM